MDLHETAYQDIFTISGNEYKGRRNIAKNEIMIPYTDDPDVTIGDEVILKAGKSDIHFKVIDVNFRKRGSLGIGTKHPNMLTLMVENTTSKPHLANQSSNTYNIGSVSGSNVQVGDGNSLSIHVSIQELTEAIAKSNDPEAKSKLKDFLNNRTVASVIGVGVAGLAALL